MFLKHCFSENDAKGWLFIFIFFNTFAYKNDVIQLIFRNYYDLCAATDECTRNQPSNQKQTKRDQIKLQLTINRWFLIHTSNAMPEKHIIIFLANTEFMNYLICIYIRILD